MSVASGGLINQSIVQDSFRHTLDFWDKHATMIFNVQIVNSEMFQRITGDLPPATPINAKTYSGMGLPFFMLPKTLSSVCGDFDGVKSVAQMCKEKGEIKAARDLQESYSFPLVLPNTHPPENPFRSVSDLEESLKGQRLAEF